MRDAFWETVCSEIRRRGAAACGTAGRAALEPLMTEEQRRRLEARVPGWRTVFCAAFPYYVDAPAPRRAISRYAWGMDYHVILAECLEPAAALLRGTGARAEILVDASPVPERAAALLAGIGMLGDHGLVIVPPYGSYVFLGTVVTDAPPQRRDAMTAEKIAHCVHCGACRRACPTGALGTDGFQMERCLSHISQKKGPLTGWEAALLRESGCLWGCDACQEACPYNRAPRETEIPAFREELTRTVTREMVSGHTNRTFRQQYGTRAFSWRGPGVLLRNLDNLESTVPAGTETKKESMTGGTDMEWKLGVTQWSLPCAVPDCVETAASLGLSAVQVDLGAAAAGYPLTDAALQKRLCADAARYGVRIVSVVCNDLCKNGFVHAPDDPRQETAYRTLALGVETAARMGVPSVCLPSFFDNRIKGEEDYARTVEALRYACELGARHGVTVYTENVMDADGLARLFRDVGCSSLRLLFDSQNYAFMAGLDAVPVFTSAKARVGDFLHVKDGIDSLGGAPLGTGTSDFARTLQAIVSGGFSGYYILENHYDTIEAAKLEIAALREWLDRAAQQ